MKILGFSGKKQSGKDTAAAYLQKRFGLDAYIVRFADYLKLIFSYCFNECEGERDFTEEIKAKKLHNGMTVREAMQYVGTDIMRNIDPDCWINAYKNYIQFLSEPIVLTTDVRFPNEVKCIQDLGGHVIRLLRTPFPDDKHESETALDWLDKFQLRHIADGCGDNLDVFSDSNLWFDAIIDNREMTIAEQNEAVWKLVKEKKWI